MLAIVMVDHSGSFASLRGQIRNSAGLRYTDFVKTLKPDYRLAWIHLSYGYLALLVIAIAEGLTQLRLPQSGWVMIPVCAVLLGYFINYVSHFFHEAVHYNLSPDRQRNDLLANVFLGVLLGQHIGPNRSLHFHHHRYLGTIEDVENSYFDPLNLKFVVYSLLGVRTLMIIRQRGDRLRSLVVERPATPASKWMFLAGAAFHGVLVLSILFLGFWWISISWTFGMLSVFPFLAALRTILEHRDDIADPNKNYYREPHGAFTRIFRGGFIGTTLGAAGFDRHLLHHWEPQVSYTRLPQLERFLLDTELASVLETRRTSYAAVFRKLLIHASNQKYVQR